MSLLYLICISVTVSSQEAGRYPAYKEMVAEYRWLNKCMYVFFSSKGLTPLNVKSSSPLFCLDKGFFLLVPFYLSFSVANGTQKSSSQGSESSSASSLSSGTPVSSLSGLSQVMFPPSLPFGSDMVDVCISTEDQRSGSGLFPHIHLTNKHSS